MTRRCQSQLAKPAMVKLEFGDESATGRSKLKKTKQKNKTDESESSEGLKD